MLNSIADRVIVESDDNLYYTLRTKTKKKTIIGTINKTYNNHVKVVDIQFRDYHQQLSASDNEADIKVNISRLTTDIINESLVVEIEEI